MAKKTASTKRTKKADRPVSELPNIGATVSRRLQEVGISTAAELKKVGPAAAYQKLRAKHPGKTMPVCYYLYSLEAALKDCHWDDLPQKVKDQLRQKAGCEK